MANSILLIIILIFAMLSALAFIGLAVYLIIQKSRNARQVLSKELDSAQADEITSTWHILNP